MNKRRQRREGARKSTGRGRSTRWASGIPNLYKTVRATEVFDLPFEFHARKGSGRKLRFDLITQKKIRQRVRGLELSLTPEITIE